MDWNNETDALADEIDANERMCVLIESDENGGKKLQWGQVMTRRNKIDSTNV